MDHPLDGAWLKAARAREHLRVLKAELAHIQIRPYRLAGAYEGEGNRYVIRFDVIGEGSTLPRRLGLMAGDVIHNLRSALDHLAWQLALAGGGENRRTQFPIFGDLDAFRSKQDQVLRGIREDDRATMERLQPFHIRAAQLGVEPGRDLGINALLMIIGRLDNVDKHTVLLPTVVVAQFRPPTFVNLVHARVSSPGPWIVVEDGAVFCELVDLVPEDPSRPVELEAEPQVTLVFGDPTPTSDSRIWTDRRLGAMSEADLFAACDAVEDVIGLFVGSFPAKA